VGVTGVTERHTAVRDGAPSAVPPRVPRRLERLPRWPCSTAFTWVLGLSALVFVTATAVLAVADGDVFILAFLPGAAVSAALGCLIAIRRPGHPIGSLLCASALASGTSDFVFAYAHAAVIRYPGALPFGTQVMWFAAWDYVPAAALGALVFPLVFPDGRLLSPRWRPALWGTAGYVVLAGAGNALTPMTMGGWFGDRPNPYAMGGPLPWVLLDLGNACGLAVAAAAVVSMVLRWRRGGHLVRQQLKLFFATMPLALGSTFIVQAFPDELLPILVLAAAASVLTAVAIGLAVLRYRLYDIDILLSRAVVYGLLSVLVAGLYLSVVAVAGGAFSTGDGLSVQLAATVAAAAVLLPVRGRLQRRVDRLFFGDRGSPYAAMARLGRQVSEATSASPVLESVVTVVAGSLRLPYAAVELLVGDDWVAGASWGQAPAEVVVFPLTFQRESVGRLLVGQRAPRERLSPDDERLLASLARQVAPAAHAVALRRALDASRTGLVTAREEERRRLRRDLHDGLGPTIAGLTLGLDTARAQCADNAELADLLTGLKTETQRAVGDIRRIVYGLRPAALDDAGLAGALREAMARLERQAPDVPVVLRVPDAGLGELPAAVEVAAYRIVTEAVTNVFRHARARSCSVTIDTGPVVRLEVCDDGTGMPHGWRAGVGITAMRERVAELGGTLVIEPRDSRGGSRGTRILARLPVRPAG
jgi:signal transduction histidine kinase